MRIFYEIDGDGMTISLEKREVAARIAYFLRIGPDTHELSINQIEDLSRALRAAVLGETGV